MAETKKSKRSLQKDDYSELLQMARQCLSPKKMHEALIEREGKVLVKVSEQPSLFLFADAEQFESFSKNRAAVVELVRDVYPELDESEIIFDMYKPKYKWKEILLNHFCNEKEVLIDEFEDVVNLCSNFGLTTETAQKILEEAGIQINSSCWTGYDNWISKQKINRVFDQIERRLSDDPACKIIKSTLKFIKGMLHI